MAEPMTHDELLKLIDRAATEGEELDLSGLGIEPLPTTNTTKEVGSGGIENLGLH